MTWLYKCILSVLFMENLVHILVSGNPFNESGVVPDVIPAAPAEVASVIFPRGLEVQIGQILTPTQVKDAPAVVYNAADDQYYTVIMVDPDAPSREDPTYREFLHWLVVNIPGSQNSSGDTLAQYVGAGPPPNATLHRYVFLVYSQPDRIVFNETRLNNTSIYKRAGFSSIGFAEKYNFRELIAANFFQTTYDAYVPILYKQLGIGSKGIGLEPTQVVLVTVLLGFIVNKIFH